MKLLKITFDTGILVNHKHEVLDYFKDLKPYISNLDIKVVSVSKRELNGNTEIHFEEIPELAEWDESFWDSSCWGDGDTHRNGDTIKKIISSGAGIPNADERTPKQRNQLRDVLILEAHVYHDRDIFVTEDLKAFISESRREILQKQFDVKIMTYSELLAYLREVYPECKP